MKNNEVVYTNLNELVVDDKNPRYSTYRDDKSDMILFMIRHDEQQMFEMVEDILLTKELNKLDNVGVVIENNKKIVVDGNRRVAALKIIFDYKDKNLLPFRFNNLLDKSKEYINSVKISDIKLPVGFFNDRTEASAWIMKKHQQKGGATMQPWSTVSQKLEAKDPIAIFVKNIMFEYKYETEDWAILVPFTTWERIFTVQILKKYFGIKKENGVYSFESEADFQQKVAVMVNLFKNKVISYNTGFVNRNQQIKTMEEIDTHLTSDYLLKSNQVFEKDSTKNRASQTSDKKSSDAKSGTKPLVKAKKQNNLNFASAKYILGKNNKLYQILLQLSNLKISESRELISISFRPLLEITVKTYYSQILNFNETRYKSDSLAVKIQVVANDVSLKSKISHDNAKVFKEFLNASFIEERMIRKLHDILHEPNTSLDENEVLRFSKEIDIFLEETWKILS